MGQFHKFSPAALRDTIQPRIITTTPSEPIVAASMLRHALLILCYTPLLEWSVRGQLAYAAAEATQTTHPFYKVPGRAQRRSPHGLLQNPLHHRNSVDADWYPGSTPIPSGQLKKECAGWPRFPEQGTRNMQGRADLAYWFGSSGKEATTGGEPPSLLAG
ncbi:hypothetical protein [Pseudarthrobacter oxydans]|uniref:hypothetical protein n=1 Tax=Pseudarthrobacter oxydans TaxID=1671 RepID=UPI00286BF025|nr:hypothetical protein [Pseudarthrobacter oxydans]